MANYNNNDRNKSGYFNQYVNFDQFLMQHNINNWSSHRGAQTTNRFNQMDPHNSNSSFHPNVSSHNPPHTASGSYRPPADWLQSSNLTVNASEFVPQTAQSAASCSTLLATANEFIPRNNHGFDEKPKKESSTSENIQSNTVLCDMGKNDRVKTKKTDENAPKTDIVTQALNNTHISDGNTNDSISLSSSGGAIKKVRSQDYRNDSRDRHING